MGEDMLENVLVPIAAFAQVVAIVWVVQAFMSRRREALLKTVRAAIERGTELSPEVIKTLGAPARDKYGDFKWGLIWLAVGLAFVTLGWAIAAGEESAEVLYIMAGVGSFPGFVGLVLIGYGAVMMRTKD